MMDVRTAADIALESSFEAMKDKGATGLRERAWEAFSRKGLPNKRVEQWHYTDLRAALRVGAPLAEAPRSAPALERIGDGLRLVILDGAFRAELSDVVSPPEGVTIQSLRDALVQGDAQFMAEIAPQGLTSEDSVVALNAALMQDGVVVRIAPGAHVERPFQIETLTSGAAAQSVFTRSLVVVGDGAVARIEEISRTVTPSGAQENNALVLSIGAGAKVEHVIHIEPQADDGVRVASLLVALERQSEFSSFCLIEGGGLLRRQIFAEIKGEYASVAFDGVSLLRGRAHADRTLIIDHTAPHGRSRERFRTILDGESTGVFQGKVIVRPRAQKTDGAMQSKALLLSEGASMNNKPELEIFADDVVCGHGATCGRLDADQLFYMEARGLPRPQAEALLIEGFANEALDAISDESTRDRLRERVRGWLASREVRS
jgi:Fe-S cluster assembly protein SufD